MNNSHDEPDYDAMTNAQHDLLPCPFCGKQPKLTSRFNERLSLSVRFNLMHPRYLLYGSGLLCDS